ncbi:hypothetical protein G3480_23980 [Thiorhodococcus mannitoliphagus]|uniref:Uncharacterized protein n=1 Tax=Thiorhodococcus mannitoliphagus TaxID=329406 RepID=A0A6P1E0A4_9GAMM|nr:hypothetical protein [Thiorhodococcus mannitoliphagus]NEX23319.1 hypothetical protein [Thiorhodococcus mannitoliphagus]
MPESHWLWCISGSGCLRLRSPSFDGNSRHLARLALILPNVSYLKRMMKKITSDILVAYAQCQRKTYLLLHADEKGKANKYITILEHKKTINQTAYLENLKNQHPELSSCNSMNLINGSNLLINAKLQSKEHESNCAVLEKILSPSLLGDYSYEPIIFVGLDHRLVHLRD